jgi:hypothetical protein
MALSARRLPSLVRVLASPVPRSQRYYEGATTSHPRIYGHLFVSLPQPTRSSSVRVSPQRSREVGGPSQAWAFAGAGCPSPACSHVDANGISQVFRRSFLCLCSVPGPRSNRRALAMSVTSMLPPLVGRRRLRRCLISGLTRSFGTCCHTLHAWRCRTRARLASGWRAAPLPGGRRTLWTATKGFSSLSRSSSSPAILTQPTCGSFAYNMSTEL